MRIREGMKILCIDAYGTSLTQGKVYTAGKCHYSYAIECWFVKVKGVIELPLLQSRFKPLLLPENV